MEKVKLEVKDPRLHIMIWESPKRPFFPASAIESIEKMVDASANSPFLATFKGLVSLQRGHSRSLGSQISFEFVALAACTACLRDCLTGASGLSEALLVHVAFLAETRFWYESLTSEGK